MKKSVEVQPKSGAEKILEKSGLKKRDAQGKLDLPTALESSGLGLEEVLGRVREISEGGESDSVRLGAAKIALELHGLLKKDTGGSIPNVVINIIDPERAGITVNPSLLPRT